MGGIDLLGQMTKYYAIDKKSQKWTIKLCFHILNIVFYNSFVLYKKYGDDSCTYLDYLCGIMLELTNKLLTQINDSSAILLPENSSIISIKGEDLKRDENH
jgi:hypothetical protein